MAVVFDVGRLSCCYKKQCLGGGVERSESLDGGVGGVG